MHWRKKQTLDTSLSQHRQLRRLQGVSGQTGYSGQRKEESSCIESSVNGSRENQRGNFVWSQESFLAFKKNTTTVFPEKMAHTCFYVLCRWWHWRRSNHGSKTHVGVVAEYFKTIKETPTCRASRCLSWYQPPTRLTAAMQFKPKHRSKKKTPIITGRDTSLTMVHYLYVYIHNENSSVLSVAVVCT